ncbi:ParA family protein [Borreliella andersonii]|uniref:ParA family protein n=1 Tax=Borrelia andersonii TaxID=42109 RepID=UPI003AB67BFE
MAKRKAKIITISSMKGGVGKSTSAIIFANILTKNNKKVLLIDMDDQSSVTSYYFEELKNHRFDVLKRNIGEVIRDKIEIIQALININNNLDLIPACITLDDLNNICYCSSNYKYIEWGLKDKLTIIKNNYDYVIIDTNPKRNFTLKAALLSSDYVISPMVAEKWSMEAFEVLKKYVDSVSAIPIFIVITRFKKNFSHKSLLDIVKFKENFLGVINEREDLNKRIGCNEEFDFSKDYIIEYHNVLDSFLSKTDILS